MISVHGCPLARLGGKESGGMNVYVRELALALGERSMAVDVFTRLTDPTLPQVVPFGPRARVIHLPAGAVGPLNKNTVLQHLPEFIHRVRSFKEQHGLGYRLVHSHYWLSAWVGAMLAERWQLPHIVMYHTLGRVKNSAREAENESWQRIAVERRTMAGADAVIAASQHEKMQMTGLYGAPADQIAVIPCGVDLALFRPHPKGIARARLGLGQKRVLVFVGRMQPLKGADLLLEALALLGARHDYHLLVIGGSIDQDPELGRLRALAVALGIAGRVSFLGAQPQQRLPLYYSAADLCVVPSHYESFGLVAMEALACGTPVIASRVGGLPTVIRDGENGLLIGWRSPDAFAQGIAAVLSDQTLRRRLTRRARPSVQHFTWQAVADQLLAVYDELAVAKQPAQVCRCGR